MRRSPMSLRRRFAAAPLAVALTAVVLAAVALATSTASAQAHVTTPKEEFGANFGDDYFLANYKQIAAYWHKLETQSDRIKVVEIGKTAEGRPHLMAIVTRSEEHTSELQSRQY